MIDIAIVLFVYNRPRHTKKTLDALRLAKGSEQLPLYVFGDGPRSEKDSDQTTRVRNIFEGIQWHSGITLDFAGENRGLANSIIRGISKVLENHEAVIVLEDDIVLAERAIRYFSEALGRFGSTKSVGSISGFAHPLKRLPIPSEYPYDSYFVTRNSSWGWATWRDRWLGVDWDIGLWSRLRNDAYLVSALKSVSPDLPGMLDNQASGKIDSWAVRFTLHHFLNGLASLTPVRSYVDNIGRSTAPRRRHAPARRTRRSTRTGRSRPATGAS